ncbi:recombinase family protein [Neobacillus piezotolerans]|uniref:recombinase family protein n=1 Tax=Neobacillus piezotolerans TaxID=2259171 RepID=UPI00319E22C6
MFTEYAQGKGLKAVANILNKNGYITKKGKLFSINGVATILDNPMYIGKIRWMRLQDWEAKRRKGKNPNPIIVDGTHIPIISDELWTIVQERRASKSFKQRQSNEPFILNALLRCPKCGQGMVPAVVTSTRKDGTKKKHRYYECGDFLNKGTTTCNANSIRANEAEEYVFSVIKKLVQDEKLLIEKILGINNITKDDESAYMKEVKQLDNRLSEISKLQERYFKAFVEKLFPIDMLQERLKQVAEEKTAIEHTLSEIKGKLHQSSHKFIEPKPIHQLLQRFVATYEEATREQKKDLIQLLVKKVKVISLPQRKRVIESVELEFDFEDLHKSKSIVLIHHLFGDSSWKQLSTISQSEKHLPLYLQDFLPLFMIRFVPIYPKSPINLLNQN